jgi:signal peptidase I
MSPRPAPTPSGKSVTREYLESIVVALILALFIRTFAVQAFKIPTGSMLDNLLVGDHLLVNKLVYSPSFGPLEDRLLGKRPIERGHVVVFKYPDEPARDFIKRVVGLPGETVEIRGRTVYIDGTPLVEPYTRFESTPARGEELEFMGGEAGANYGPEVVPKDKLFVLGDNRDNSRDSRFWGFLPRDQIKGRALLIYWSYEAKKEDYQTTSWLQWLRETAKIVVQFHKKTRWDRFFHLVR